MESKRGVNTTQTTATGFARTFRYCLIYFVTVCSHEHLFDCPCIVFSFLFKLSFLAFLFTLLYTFLFLLPYLPSLFSLLIYLLFLPSLFTFTVLTNYAYFQESPSSTRQAYRISIYRGSVIQTPDGFAHCLIMNQHCCRCWSTAPPPPPASATWVQGAEDQSCTVRTLASLYLLLFANSSFALEKRRWMQIRFRCAKQDECSF